MFHRAIDLPWNGRQKKRKPGEGIGIDGSFLFFLSVDNDHSIVLHISTKVYLVQVLSIPDGNQPCVWRNGSHVFSNKLQFYFIEVGYADPFLRSNGGKP